MENVRNLNGNLIVKKVAKHILTIFLGIPKSLYFNIYYFGIKKGVKLPILLSPKVKILKMKGEINLKEYKTGIIKIGFPSVGIFDYKYSRSIWENSGKILFLGKASLGQGTKISVGESGILEMGKNFCITAQSEVVCFKNIKFGKNCLISWDNLFLDTDFHKIFDENSNNINKDKQIKIGNNVWIGCRNTILKGSYIADNTIIGAGTTVSGKYSEEFTILSGKKAEIIKNNVTWGL